MDRDKPLPEFRQSLHGLPYHQTVAADPPIRVKTSTSPLRVPDDTTQANAPAAVGTPANTQADGAFLSATASARDSETSLSTTKKDPGCLGSTPSIPQIRVDHGSSAAPTPKDEPPQTPLRPSRSITFATPEKDTLVKKRSEPFLGITLDLPGGLLSEDIPTENMEFSKRGSMLIDGQKINGKRRNGATGFQARTGSRRVRSNPSMRDPPPQKLLSVEEETLSQKVRSFYEAGAEMPNGAETHSSLASKMGLRWQDALINAEGSSVNSLSRATSTTEVHSETFAEPSIWAKRESLIQREENELAGGLEDWQDIDNADVDRYGFIIPRSPTTNTDMSDANSQSVTSREPQQLQRVSTSLQLASETPRRTHTLKRTPSHAKGSSERQLPESPRPRPTTSQSARGSIGRYSTMRHTTNKLPHNRSRKLMDEAANIFTLPPSSRGVPEADQLQHDDRARRKETEREEKWRKMARVISSNSGGGMIFDFDTKNPKLIERTWKGIPDRWRATAWHAFLSASAQRRKDAPTDDALIERFHDYSSESSPDDVQIDIDVPRTISSHIMFRRRYRGGQRLLFRVLHAMSLHFPDTGYVQGMATLAATLLAYYEEERAFVMLVRLWDLRGLDKLYKSGFGGLMQALGDFEKHWLGAGEVAAKLVSRSPRAKMI